MDDVFKWVHGRGNDCLNSKWYFGPSQAFSMEIYIAFSLINMKLEGGIHN
jgi:hypothetical protein